ncbi:hypothetical protein V8G54_033151 [Vigna mungo]|uniref:Uncharacterized protein n=1 Tax=Vigna mungo TaxID=3915 RepID=A0AAQ3RIM3_VIGMU
MALHIMFFIGISNMLLKCDRRMSNPKKPEEGRIGYITVSVIQCFLVGDQDGSLKVRTVRRRKRFVIRVFGFLIWDFEVLIGVCRCKEKEEEGVVAGEGDVMIWKHKGVRDLGFLHLSAIWWFTVGLLSNQFVMSRIMSNWIIDFDSSKWWHGCCLWVLRLLVVDRGVWVEASKFKSTDIQLLYSLAENLRTVKKIVVLEVPNLEDFQKTTCPWHRFGYRYLFPFIEGVLNMGPKSVSDMKMNAIRSGIVVLGTLAFGYLSIQIGFKPYLEKAQKQNALYQSDPSQEESPSAFPERPS